MRLAWSLITAAIVVLPGCRSAPPLGGGPVGKSAAADAARLVEPPAPPVRPASFVAVEEDAQIEPVELPAPAVPEDFELADLERLALMNNPSLLTAQARIEALRGRSLQAILPPNPVIGYQAMQMGDQGAAGQQGAFWRREFIRGGKRQLDQAVVNEEIEAALQQLAAQQLRVLTDVRTGYVDLTVAQWREQLAGELVDIGNRAAEDTRELLMRGEVRQADLLRAEAEAATMTILLETARTQKNAAWRRLAVVVGLPDLVLPALPPDVIQRRIEEAATIDVDRDQALQRLVDESPLVAAALTGVERARWALDRAHAESVPNLNVEVSGQHDAATGDDLVGFELSLPIPYKNWNQGGIRQAEADLVAAGQAVEQAELGLRQQFERVYQRYAAARLQVRQYTQRPDGILEKTRKMLELTRLGYQAEELTSLEMLTAQRIFTQANLAYLDALRQAWTAAVEIEGLLLKDSLPAP